MAMKNLDETIIRRYVDILSDAGFKAVFGDDATRMCWRTC